MNASAFFEKSISPSLNTFISYRFEDIAKQYFIIKKRTDVLSVGTYWYDNKKEKRNGEFDVALETLTGYEMYEVKYYGNPLPSEVTRQEIDKATSIEGISLSTFGIISASGFEDDTNPIRKITGEELYK